MELRRGLHHLPRLSLIVAVAAALGLTAAEPSRAAEAEDRAKPAAHVATLSAAQLAERARPSVAVVSFTGRNDRDSGVGTGFVLTEDGLLATNLHVIGEGRPIQVQFANGQRYDVTEVHASERSLDLAIIRINAKGLTPLPLGNGKKLTQGQPIVAVGNPHGLKHSVVSGILSAQRNIDEKPMLQLAIPVEPGNSGGPVLDRHGRVIGIMTLKSAITENLGFAVNIDALKPLIEKPNPLPMDRWLTIGSLDKSLWRPRLGARWRQRAGRILVQGMGEGFGGRSLCIHQKQPPKLPYELAVSVRLDDEAGAAGLLFESDGGEKHYGFYPTAGSLRLTRFDGPNVFTWKIIRTVKSPHYRPGEFNTLKVRVEEQSIRCYVNDQLVIEAMDNDLRGGKAGLCKFRGTAAEFKGFQAAKQIAPTRPTAELAAAIRRNLEAVDATRELEDQVIDALKRDAKAAAIVLEEEAKALEARAAKLRELAKAAHQRKTIEELTRETAKPDKRVDLGRAALLIARLDNAEVDIDAYRAELDRIAADVRAKLGELAAKPIGNAPGKVADEPKDTRATERQRLDALRRHLFADTGYHGSRTNYYSRSNSYLNEVIDDREGLPITLSVLFMEIARRLDLRVEGVGLPGHFVVRFVPSKQANVNAQDDQAAPQKPAALLIDVFDRGKLLTRDGAATLVNDITGQRLTDAHLEPVTKKQVIQRMLSNLLRAAQQRADYKAMLPYLDALVAMDETASYERWMRAVVRAQTGQHRAAMRDAAWLLKHRPEDVDMRRVQQLREALEAMD